MADTDEARRRVEGRSPSFPFIPLDKAIEQARKLERECKGHLVRVATAIETFGYKPDSSGGRQTISALKAFGLLIDTGSKEDRKVQLTEFARRLLLNPPAPVEREMVRDAALKPRLIREMWDRWGPYRPPATECRYTLVADLGFTAAAAVTFLGVYDATVAFAGLDKSDTLAEQEDGLGADLPAEPDPSPRRAARPTAEGGRAQAEPDAEVQVMEGERELERGLLSREASFRLIVKGDVGPAEIDRLIKRLLLTKETLAEQPKLPAQLDMLEDERERRTLLAVAAE